MATPIRVVIGELMLDGERNDAPHACELARALPIEGNLCSFGDSYYVETDVDKDPGAEGTAAVEVGDIGYWHPALAMQFFFGETPVSAPGSGRPVPAGEVVRVGTIRDAHRLAGVRHARKIRVERI